MLSKEEIHNCLSEVMKILAIANIDREDKKLGQYVCDLQKVENYIDKLEADKQKLIKKLEEDKMKEFDDYTICLIESYLKILKGERDVK